MHYEILGDPIFREREVPRMLELAVARADGDTSRARRSSIELRRRAAAAEKQASRSSPTLIRYRAAWVLPIAAPPIRDGWVAVDRGRIVALRSAAGAVPAPTGARRRSRRRRDPARPRQRAHPSRAVVSARRRCRRPRSSSPGFAASWRRGAQRPDPQAPEILDGDRRGDRRGGRAAAPRSSATSATRW